MGEMRECKRPGCGNLAKKSLGYCSRSCAPFGHLSDDRKAHTKLKPTRAEFGTPGRGVPSQPFAAAESRIAPAVETVESAAPSQEDQEMQRNETSALGSNESLDPGLGSQRIPGAGSNTAGQTLSAVEQSGVSGTSETESDIVPMRSGEETLETRLVESFKPSNGLNEARLDSLNLIDESANHLHGLLKSVAVDDEVRLKDPRVIHAAANCAKQIHSLMRLKLDVLKEVRKR